MKTTIVLDTESFRVAERESAQLRVSVPEFCSLAIREFAQNHHKSSITEQLNAVYAECPAKMDEDILQAQYDSLGEEDW
ncbi:MAG: hypothetical protein LBT00_00475 [Spirochaetaceae bacterium]|nr:hypothetical protein [Spirochaetaceae bacterium]